MRDLLQVAFGGAVGAVTRWTLGGLVLHHAEAMKFPLSTFLVNVLGCLACGLLVALGERQDWLTAPMRLLLFTGLLGGFTTFSAFGLELTSLLRRGDLMIAASYAVLSVACGVAALLAGISIAGGAR